MPKSLVRLMRSAQDIPKTRRKQNGDVHPLVVIRFYNWIVWIPDFLPKGEGESRTVAYRKTLWPVACMRIPKG